MATAATVRPEIFRKASAGLLHRHRVDRGDDATGAREKGKGNDREQQERFHGINRV
jgi:hypothetical protein